MGTGSFFWRIKHRENFTLYLVFLTFLSEYGWEAGLNSK
jgi:hypothetical protein